jgi:hypothetical protein
MSALPNPLFAEEVAANVAAHQITDQALLYRITISSLCQMHGLGLRDGMRRLQRGSAIRICDRVSRLTPP